MHGGAGTSGSYTGMYALANGAAIALMLGEQPTFGSCDLVHTCGARQYFLPRPDQRDRFQHAKGVGEKGPERVEEIVIFVRRQMPFAQIILSERLSLCRVELHDVDIAIPAFALLFHPFKWKVKEREVAALHFIIAFTPVAGKDGSRAIVQQAVAPIRVE